jgi:hypothetical protein
MSPALLLNPHNYDDVVPVAWSYVENDDTGYSWWPNMWWLSESWREEDRGAFST